MAPLRKAAFHLGKIGRMPKNEKITFVGRNDGLGNRLEEIIVLNAYSIKYACHVKYLFNNIGAREDRTYELLFWVDNPIFSVKKATKLNTVWARIVANLGFRSCFYISDLDVFRRKVSKNNIRESAKKILPLFEYEEFPRDCITALHIRASDRISKERGPHFLQSRSDLENGIASCISYLSHKETSKILVFSEEPEIVAKVKKSIGNVLSIPKAVPKNKSLPSAEFRDLFAMSRCNFIILAGAPSSFCLIAALIGGKSVAYVYLPEDFRNRYPNEYIKIQPNL